MTEEKNFWINKAEVYTLSNAEGTLYKVTRKTMNRKGWYKLAGNKEIIRRVVLTPEEAEWFEENRTLPSPNFNINLEFFNRLAEQATKYPDIDRWGFVKRIMQAYALGSYVVKERQYYIKLNFDDYGANYLSMDDGGWFWDNPTDFGDCPTRFTQEEIDQMQKDPQAKGLDLNALKVEVPEDELED